MTKISPESRVERFPQGWAVRRPEGTLKAVIAGDDDAARRRALAVAEEMLLSAKAEADTNVNRDFARPPSVVVSIRRRHRGRAARPEKQYSINVSLQLVLFSHSEASGGRYHRWHKVSLGEMGALTDKAISEAWMAVYGAWAWATHLRMTYRVQDLLNLPVPARTCEYLAMLEGLPEPRTKQQLWDDYGFDPATHTDSKARLAEIDKLAGRA